MDEKTGKGYWKAEQLEKESRLKEEDYDFCGKKLRIREIGAFDRQTIFDETQKASKTGTFSDVDTKKAIIMVFKYGVVKPDMSVLSDEQIMSILRNSSFNDVINVINRINKISGISVTPEMRKEAEKFFRGRQKQK